MRRFVKRLLAGLFSVLLAGGAGMAMNAGQKEEFDRIASLGLIELTEEAADLLARKYPEEDWEKHRFPAYVYADRSVKVGYMIAAVEPYDLPVTMCYCFCEAMGHETLLSCFWKDGRVGGEFDDHGAGCTICYGQAMLAFLWKNLGADDEEIRRGMEEKFAPLIESRKEFLEGQEGGH